MKFLLGQNMVYQPTHGGASKSNRMLLEALAARGHSCLAVTPMGGVQGPAGNTLVHEQVGSAGTFLPRETGGILSYISNGVTVLALEDSRTLARHFRKQIAEFAPDWIIVTSEDTFSTLLSAALKEAPSRVIYLARTTLLLPFGPDAALKDNYATALLSKVNRIYCVSRFLQNYIHRWADLDSTVVPLSFYGLGPFPNYGHFERGYVTLVNPCRVKGISIFLALAKLFPTVAFAGVPTWGTTSKDQSTLLECPNITVMPPSDNINDILQNTRILLVPSLWAEGKGEIVIEAMLRGIPALVSNTGGLPEAALAVGFVLPVQQIIRYERDYDDRMIPIALVPEQNVGPWKEALALLLEDESHYYATSFAVQHAAQRYAESSTVVPFLRTLDGSLP
jgi:glycosyltransferase involved in cell wall biosynthesis